jgi:hypothetical protein
MVQAGLVRLQIGTETGNQEIMNIYGKKSTIEDIEFVVREAVRSGIPQMATNFIIGGPKESKNTVKETQDFAERLLRMAPGIIDILTGFLRSYPGTAITNNPSSFGLSIGDSETSFDDYPAVIPQGTTPEDIMLYRLQVSRHITNIMKEIVDTGQVPYKTILSQYRLMLTYNIKSIWYLEVFKKNQFLDEYFRLIAKGASVCFDDVPPHELTNWRPLRTMEIRKAVNFEEGFPRIGKYVLSPLEFELLLHCSAKLRFKEVLESLYSIFGSRFDSIEDFNKSVSEIFRLFDKRHWVVFCRL